MDVWRNVRGLCAIALPVLAAGCAASPQPPSAASIHQARAQLTVELQTCTSTYGYSPREAKNVPQHALAPNELAWNQCAYNAVRNYEKANPALAPMYENLITSYQSMTNDIQKGTMTRSERQARLDAELDQIKAKEQAQIAAENLPPAQQDQQFQNVVNTARMLGTMSIGR